MAHMYLVTTSVLSSSNNYKFLMPWTITRFNDSYSVLEFFYTSIKPRLDCDCLLSSAFVGQEKHLLDLVDVNLPLAAIIPAFGRYLQYKVNFKDDDAVAAADISENDSLSLPEPVRERNRKDVLYNHIISFFNSFSVGLTPEEMPLAKKLLVTVRDIFWYIDGHHHVFERVNKPIPSVFQAFTGFNIPELSKHRKRQTRNISADQLRDYALDVSQLLLENYWERNNWRNIKPHFVDLFSSLSCYSDHLVEKNKKSKENHRSPTPVRELSEHLTLKLLKASESPVPSSLEAIDELVSGLSVYTHSLTHPLIICCLWNL